jgi:hypothetical protein
MTQIQKNSAALLTSVASIEEARVKITENEHTEITGRRISTFWSSYKDDVSKDSEEDRPFYSAVQDT